MAVHLTADVMTTLRFNPPPPPSTPKHAPWTDAESALAGLNQIGDDLEQTHADLLALIDAIKAIGGGGGGGVLPSPLYGLYMYEDYGLADNGNQTSLLDNKKNWQPNMWLGHTLFTLINSILFVSTIISNDAHNLVFALPTGVLIQPGAPYWITSGTGGLMVTKIVTQILSMASLAAATTSALTDCVAIDLSGGEASLALTVACTYDPAAVAGIRVHVRTSFDGVNYDTVDWDTWTPGFAAGGTLQQTKVYDTSPAYIKVLIENLDAAQTVTLVTAESTRQRRLAMFPRRPPTDEVVSIFDAIVARKGQTTAPGVAGGTSIIDSGLIGAGANSFVNMGVVLYPGDPLRVDARTASLFNNVTGELTLDAAYKGVAAPIAAGVPYVLIPLEIVPGGGAPIILALNVPAIDSIVNLLERDVIGNKADTANAVVGVTSSQMRYIKAVLNQANKLAGAAPRCRCGRQLAHRRGYVRNSRAQI